MIRSSFTYVASLLIEDHGLYLFSSGSNSDSVYDQKFSREWLLMLPTLPCLFPPQGLLKYLTLVSRDGSADKNQY